MASWGLPFSIPWGWDPRHPGLQQQSGGDEDERACQEELGVQWVGGPGLGSKSLYKGENLSRGSRNLGGTRL